MVESGVIGRRTDDESAILEDIPQDVAVMGLGDIVKQNVLEAGFGGCLGYDLGHALGVAVHGAITDDQAWHCGVAAHTVVHAHDFVDVAVPNRAVSGTNVGERQTGELLQGVLHRDAILTHDVGVVTGHLVPAPVGVDGVIDDTSVEGSEAAKGISAEEGLGGRLVGHHGLGPVDHGGEVEGKVVLAESDGFGVFHLYTVIGDTIEALEHTDGLLVAYHLHIGIILAQQGDRPAVVGFHVVDDEIIDGATADDFADIADISGKEIDLHGIDETHFVVVDEVRIVRDSIWERPQSFEERLVAVVDSYIVNVIINNVHIKYDLVIACCCRNRLRYSCRYSCNSRRQTPARRR